jgi:hypothetical protein
MTSLTFARFDLRSWLPRTQTLLPLVLVAAVGIVLPVPAMAIVAAALVTSLTVSAPFLTDERDRLDTLYGVLPVSRGAVVAGRAIALVVYFFLAAVLAVLVTVAVALVRGWEVPVEITIVALGAAFAIVGLATIIQLPVLFKMGYSRGRLVAYAPPLVLAGAAWLAGTLDALDPVAAAFSGIPPIVMLGVGAVLGVLGIVVGAMISVGVYRRREL